MDPKRVWLSLYSLIDRILLRRSPRVVAVSDEIANSLHRIGVSPGKVSVIDNGIDTSTFASAEPTLRRDLQAGSVPIVGLVGRLTPQKGPDYLLQAASLGRREIPDALYVFVGDGPDKQNLHIMAERLSIADKVIFVGKRDDMPGVYKSLDVLVLPSRDEGMPMTVIEALAAGTPVIATRVGSVPKLIKDAQTGRLTAPGDIPGLAQAIIGMLGDSGFRQRCAAASRELVRQQYSADAMATRYLSLYAETLSAARRDAPSPVAVLQRRSVGSRHMPTGSR